MALIKEGLWDIVNGTETAPTEGVERQAKFAMRRDKALATIVLCTYQCIPPPLPPRA